MDKAPTVFQTWRAEIEAELADAITEMDDAEAELSAATEAASIAKTQHHAIASMFARRDLNRPLAGALRDRLHGAVEVARQPQGRFARAQEALETARRSVDDRRSALEQLDKIAPRPASEPEMAEPA